MPTQQREDIFDLLPDGIMVCDREGKILRANTAALTLFEVSSEALCRGVDYQEFLGRYQRSGEPQPASTLEPRFMGLLVDEDAACRLHHETRVLHLPCGRTVYVILCAFPLRDAQQQPVGTIAVFRDITYRYQKALHLQRVHQAVSRLREAITHIPESLAVAPPYGDLPAVASGALRGAAVGGRDQAGPRLPVCRSSRPWAWSPSSTLCGGKRLHPGARPVSPADKGYFLLSDFVDATVLARLSAGQEVVLPIDRLHRPPDYRADLFAAQQFLLVPLLLEQQLVGALVIAKPGVDSEYTPEEIELVKAVAEETMLVIDCLHCWYEQAETRSRALARQELDGLITDFLNLASHELKTPLTTIKGNLQLAQRRLATLKRQLAEQPGGVSEQLERLQAPGETFPSPHCGHSAGAASVALQIGPLSSASRWKA